MSGGGDGISMDYVEGDSKPFFNTRWIKVKYKLEEGIVVPSLVVSFLSGTCKH